MLVLAFGPEQLCQTDSLFFKWVVGQTFESYKSFYRKDKYWNAWCHQILLFYWNFYVVIQKVPWALETWIFEVTASVLIPPGSQGIAAAHGKL